VSKNNKNKKEDGFKTIENGQEITHFSGKDAIQKAHNWLDQEEKKYHKENMARFDKAGPTIAPRNDRVKFLKYAISLMNPRKDEREIIFLQLRIHGYPLEVIAKQLTPLLRKKISIDDVKKIETLAIKKAKDAIARTKATKIPILGG